MPPLRGFSDNQFRTRDDVVLAAESLLKPLVPYFSNGKARIKLPLESGAHFDDNAAQLEGYARPLWLVGALLSAQSDTASEYLLKPWITGLRNGVDPSHEEYWGPVGDWDQRMVEAEIISFALLSAPERMYYPLSAESKSHLTDWLKGLNGKVMPENNWRFFRVLSNLALIKVCGVSHDELWPLIEKDLATLESFYLSDGWASDGIWRPISEDPETEGTGENATRGRHADYYSGSFAIQFSQLLYAKFADELDPERASLYRSRARAFARTFWAYFDTDGAAIPYGRSLCYKFAMGGFYAAFAYSGVYDDADTYCSAGVIKGMLLRHLRWWVTHSKDIFYTDGTLNIGYLYPNMYMSEHYNSPQSPYWALKSLIVVALDADDAFWAAEEMPYPTAEGGAVVSDVLSVKPARQIVCNHAAGDHHFLLSSGQFCVWSMKATEAKYAKFAYSSAFGFSVPTGPSLTQMAPDSTLALSLDDGETWAVRWKTIGDAEMVSLPLSDGHCHTTALVSRWRPWKLQPIEIETTLVAPCDRWPDWHVRIHRICRTKEAGTSTPLSVVEGGFAIHGTRKGDGRFIAATRVKESETTDLAALDSSEAALELAKGAFVISSAGASGILDLTDHDKEREVSGEVLRVDPNTNLMSPRTILPLVRHRVRDLSGGLVITTAVFSVDFGKKSLDPHEIRKRWDQKPCIYYEADSRWKLA